MTLITASIDESVLDELVNKKLKELLTTLDLNQSIVWDMNDLCTALGNKKPEWVREHILYNSKLMPELNELREKGLIWGGGKGGTWKMVATDIKRFIDKNREIIFRER